jgi:hypothetical protein
LNNLLGQTFTSVVQDQNVIVSSNTSFNFGGAGVGFFDFNNDGWDDLTFLMENDSQVFYLNNNGQFHKLPSFIFSQGETKQVLWVDYDNDGDNDLFVSMLNGPIKLFQNDGNFNFTDVSFQAGLSPVNAANYGANFGDYDKDGFLDFYICRYVGSGNPMDITVVNNLYRNNGDGTFTNVTFQAGVADGIAPSFQAVWIDYDKDSWPDLYVINDRNSWGNTMYRNNGDGTFTDVTTQTNTELFGQDPMTATVGDFDNDGDLDIYMTNTALFPGPGQKKGMFLVNNGDGTFDEKAEQFGVDIDQYSWGATWIDFNNDTYQDLYVTTSRFSPLEPIVKNFFYVNSEAQVFIDSPDVFMGDHVARSMSVAKGDINNDGYADLVVSNVSPYRSFLWQNSGAQNNFIKITLQGTSSNKMAIGSWIYAYAGGNRYTHYTLCGENFVSQNSQHHIFGLANFEMVDSVVVEYLSGITDTYYNLAVNNHYTFIEGETLSSEIIATKTIFCEGDSAILDAGDFESYLWNTGSTNRFLTVYESGFYNVLVEHFSGNTLLSNTVEVNVFSIPIIDTQVNPISCFGQEDGSVLLNIQTDALNFDVQWSNGADGSEIENLSAGVYTFNYSDEYGCVFQDSISISEPFEINIQYQITNQTDTSLGSLLLAVNGGAPPYIILINGDTAQTENQDLIAGFYNVQIFDAFNCLNSILLEVLIDSTSDDTLSIRNIRNSGFNVFPNPFKDEVYIVNYNKKDFKLKLLDATGMQLLKWNNEEIINLSFLNNGVYFLVIKNSNGVFIEKLVKSD